jgi:predicted transcriptional regulator
MKNEVNYSLGPLEREILKIVWADKEVCVRHVLEKLPQNLDPAYTTVMTLMNRMVEKGVLERKKPNTTCYYQATQNKKDFLKSLTETKISTIINQYSPEVIPFLKETISRK